MANQIKASGATGTALQVTTPARTAGFVEETEEGDVTYLSEVRVFAFDHLLLVVDLVTIRNEQQAYSGNLAVPVGEPPQIPVI